jgi:hypothetical protein
MYTNQLFTRSGSIHFLPYLPDIEDLSGGTRAIVTNTTLSAKPLPAEPAWPRLSATQRSVMKERKWLLTLGYPPKSHWFFYRVLFLVMDESRYLLRAVYAGQRTRQDIYIDVNQAGNVKRICEEGRR